jgi:hypothetical protein
VHEGLVRLHLPPDPEGGVMGTNYYSIESECLVCDRCERRHICKNLTSFQGFFTEGPDYKDVPWIVSWQDWKDHLRDEAVRVEDEHGRTYEVEDFIAKVEATSPDARRRQYDWMFAHEPAQAGPVENGCDWLDADSFSFYGGGFE